MSTFSDRILIDPINAIVDGQLYVGDREAAASLALLQELGVTHVVNTTADEPNFFPGAVAYLRYFLRNPFPSPGELEAPLQFIQRAVAQGGVILVHCGPGVSCFESILTAYLMRVQGMSPSEAAQRVGKVVLHPSSQAFTGYSEGTGTKAGFQDEWKAAPQDLFPSITGMAGNLLHAFFMGSGGTRL